MSKKKKPWAGRFQKETDKLVEAFTASIHFDKRLYPHDIEGSKAHARMLAKQGIISRSDKTAILKGLQSISHELDKGNFIFHEDDEDIHMAIEKALIAEIGEAGEKLHTARSRNDQVALDMRLYLREEIKILSGIVNELKDTFIRLAEKEYTTILPGYTHLQKAQPVLLSHYLMAYWEMLNRDCSRLTECYQRVNIMPLGAAALAGTALPIDREYTARLLRFPQISQNSMDAVSDRDFVIEFCSVAAIIMMHLSRFSEDIIIWSTDEFRFVEIDDAFTTGSSIMPQKKNPDVAELIRGKTSRAYGNLMSLLTMMKGLPLTYNRDLQEDKERLFDTVDTVKACLQVLNAMLMHLTFNRKKMLEDAGGGFSTATDLAEYLVKKGVPFRSAHGVVGSLVAYCLKHHKTFASLSLEEYHNFHEDFEMDVYNCLTVMSSTSARDCIGGTAEMSVRKRIAEIKRGRAKHQ